MTLCLSRYGGTCVEIVVVRGNGHGEQSSNPGHANILGKRSEYNYYPYTYEQVGQTDSLVLVW